MTSGFSTSEDENMSPAERRFRLVVEAAPNAMVMVDRAGEIAMVNAQAERVFGYSRAELLGHPVEMLVPERFRHHHPGLREAFFANPGRDRWAPDATFTASERTAASSRSRSA
jgi:PAS domain-containing protein